MTVHPNYVTSDLTNDIAIITLATEATFNNYVQPICLWDSSDTSDVAGKFGTVVGWGRTEERKLANVLRQASVPIVPSSTCTNQSTTLSQYLTERTFCAGYLNGRFSKKKNCVEGKLMHSGMSYRNEHL